MNTLRDLLLDCRTALRRADPTFAQSPLRTQLDEAITAAGEARSPQVDEVRAPETRTAQQVAYAWQMAARDLRFSQPELHAKLTERVRQLLDIEVLSDPATEIENLQARVDAATAAAQASEFELNDLRHALAEAVPSINDPKTPPAEAARLRMRALLDGHVRHAVVAPEVKTGSSNLGPTREKLLAVAEGRRTLTRDERDWCMGEAMVLSGFQQTPIQLLAQGEAELARMILEAQTS